MEDSWNKVLAEKASELELIASWASVTQYGRVRDLCREARSILLAEIARREEALKDTRERNEGPNPRDRPAGL